MARIVVHAGAQIWLGGVVDPTQWTVLVAAAGRGTRLGFDKPKILLPVAGRTILERLVALFKPLCEQFVFVVSPSGLPLISPEAERLLPGRHCMAIQPSPEGMGDAVACGLPEVQTRNIAVVWGDQVALRPASLEFCMRLLHGGLSPAAVCPTVLRDDPYIHFERDGMGKITRVLQKREGDIMPPNGESDSGVFFFEANALRRELGRMLIEDRARGNQTGEQNFLPVLVELDAVPGQLVTARIISEEESVGVNSQEDVQYLEGRGLL